MFYEGKEQNCGLFSVTLIAETEGDTQSVDVLVIAYCESMTLQTYWVLVVMDWCISGNSFENLIKCGFHPVHLWGKRVGSRGDKCGTR